MYVIVLLGGVQFIRVQQGSQPWQRSDVHGVREDALRQHALVVRIGDESGADDLSALLFQRLHLVL